MHECTSALQAHAPKSLTEASERPRAVKKPCAILRPSFGFESAESGCITQVDVTKGVKPLLTPGQSILIAVVFSV